MDHQLLFWPTASFDGPQGDKVVPRLLYRRPGP